MPWRKRDGRLYGPGVLDMKSGVAMALTAIRALTQLGVSRPITLLLNSDEEVGSPASRPITERLALASQAVLVLEPAQGLACKTARKGVGGYRIDVTGVASHSGVDFASGHSAILELARLIEKVAGFTDLRVGRTVNPGVISGGTRANVVAEHAFAEVDVRIARASDAARVERLFRSLRCCRSGVQAGDYRRHQPSADGAQARNRRALQAGAQAGRRTWLPARRGLQPAAAPTATSPPRSASPRWTASAPSAKARTPPTNPSSSNTSSRAPPSSPPCSPIYRDCGRYMPLRACEGDASPLSRRAA